MGGGCESQSNARGRTVGRKIVFSLVLIYRLPTEDDDGTGVARDVAAALDIRGSIPVILLAIYTNTTD